MAQKRKLSVTVDGEVLDELLARLGEHNVSAVVDRALRSALRRERLANDVKAYGSDASVDEAWSPTDWSFLADGDDVDWEAAFDDSPGRDAA